MPPRRRACPVCGLMADVVWRDVGWFWMPHKNAQRKRCRHGGQPYRGD